jgi:hypothetical protein
MKAKIVVCSWVRLYVRCGGQARGVGRSILYDSSQIADISVMRY